MLSCAPAKRFPESKQKDEKIEKEEKLEKEETTESEPSTAEVRVLLNRSIPSESLKVESTLYLYNKESKVALVKSGNTINCLENYGKPRLIINGENFDGEKFFLSSAESNGIIKVNGKRYRGKIQISSSNDALDIINVLNLEDYVKGVLAKEMPLGKDEENLEALKALAICVRTYATQKIEDGNIYFDLYADTRDQVYGGVDAESPLSNKAVKETNNLILKHDGSQSIIFYHSTCGGYTESSQNVFTKEYIPYLTSIKDGSDPYCKISPRFEWTETYSKEIIISRLKSYSLLDNSNYRLEDISILSRFDSGRVNEMEIIVSGDGGEKNSVIIKGNEIRSIIRTADGKMILWSTLFDLSVRSNSVILIGKGFGHGVGLCQWGAIALSRKGWNYKDILNHYYPGIEASKLND
ncbi:MAG: SpoIID/LytB domain-containing protein [Ignavibacteriaceae bacterium]|nr:SpoIID/LytB domain-containing protein [Ignavibacteriaceae bacterium]